MSYYSTEFSWLIAIGILIALPILLTYFSEDKFTLSTVLIYMTIINAFLVSTDILPLWTQVLFLIVLVGVSVMELKSDNNRGL